MTETRNSGAEDAAAKADRAGGRPVINQTAQTGNPLSNSSSRTGNQAEYEPGPTVREANKTDPGSGPS